jgi:hypothetical protein
MRFTCWTNKDTDMHWEYIIRIAFHGDSGYTNATSCYVMQVLPLVLCLQAGVLRRDETTSKKSYQLPTRQNHKFDSGCPELP